jgi:hypothetical protein
MAFLATILTAILPAAKDRQLTTDPAPCPSTAGFDAEAIAYGICASSSLRFGRCCNLAHHVVKRIAEQEPAISGHRHPRRPIDFGLDGRAAISPITCPAGPRDTSDHTMR